MLGLRKDPSIVSSTYSYSSKYRRRISQSERQYAQAIMTDYVDKAIESPHAFADCMTFFPRRFREIPRSECQHRVSGCCMLISLMGLNDITLSRRNDSDSELSSGTAWSYVNSVFVTLIECVYGFGGDVISFHHDSMLCLFHETSDHNSAAKCCANAAQCGLNISQSQICGIGLKVAATYGKMNFAILGGYNGKCSYILNGYCVDTIGSYINEVGANEFVISQEVYTIIANEIAVLPMAVGMKVVGMRRHSTLKLQGPKLSWELVSACNSNVDISAVGNGEFQFPHAYGEIGDRDLISCIPVPVVKASVLDNLTTLRASGTVTALYLKVDTYTSEDYDDLTNMQPFVFAMQKCLDECGGMLKQFLIHDLSCVLVCLWGVPTAAHAANCSKAVRCAVMMKNEAEKQRHRVSIGITTGRISFGVVGTEYRQEYVLVGKSLDLAAQLMTHSKGRILLDNDTLECLALDVASCTCITEALLIPGLPAESQFHHYRSPIPPSLYKQDVRPDRDVIIESYVRRAIVASLDLRESTAYAFCETSSSTSIYSMASDGENMISRVSAFSPSQIASDFTSRSNVSGGLIPGNVLVIAGVSGLGKTAVVNYLVRKFLSRDETLRERFPHNTRGSAVYVSLIDADDTYCSGLKKIFSAVFSWFGKHDMSTQKDFVVGMIGKAFPYYSATTAVVTLFPVVEKVLSANWDWGVTVEPEKIRICKAYAEYREEKTDCDILAELLFYILSEGVPALCIDDAHFMCSFTWRVLTRLCILGPASLIVLTLRVNDLPAATMTSEVIKFQQSEEGKFEGKGRIELPRLHSYNTSTTAMLDRSDSVVPVRHASEYASLLQSLPDRRVLKLHLRKLSARSVKKIIGQQYQCRLNENCVDTVCNITQSNPFLIWKFMQFAYTSCHDDLEVAIFRVLESDIMTTLTVGLSDTESSIVRTASVVGEQFSIDVLKAVLPRHLSAYIHSALQSLETTGILVPLSDGFYSFTNSLIRLYVYNKIPRSDAVVTHSKVASAIEKMHPSDFPNYSVSICYHYTMSEVGPQKKMTFKWSCTAANSYLQCGDVIAAMPYLDVAIQNASSRKETSKVAGILAKMISSTREQVNCTNNTAPVPLLLETLHKQEDIYANLLLRRNFYAGVKITIQTILSSLRFKKRAKVCVEFQ